MIIFSSFYITLGELRRQAKNKQMSNGDEFIIIEPSG